METQSKFDWGLLILLVYFLFRVFTIIFEDSIRVEFDARKSAPDLVDSGVIASSLRDENFPAFIAIQGVSYVAYVSNENPYKEDLGFAKLRNISIEIFFAFGLALAYIMIRQMERRELRPSSQLFSLGALLFIAGLIFFITDRVWLINFFFSNTKRILPLVTVYSFNEGIVRVIALFALLGFLIYAYRTARMTVQSHQETSANANI